MADRWSWAGAGVGAAWLLAFAGVGLWELRAAEPFSLRGGQAGLPHPRAALVLVLGGPLALLATLGCALPAVIRRRGPGAGRLWVAALGPALVVVGGLAVYALLGLVAPGNRAEPGSARAVLIPVRPHGPGTELPCDTALSSRTDSGGRWRGCARRTGGPSCGRTSGKSTRSAVACTRSSWTNEAAPNPRCT